MRSPGRPCGLMVLQVDPNLTCATDLDASATDHYLDSALERVSLGCLEVDNNMTEGTSEKDQLDIADT